MNTDLILLFTMLSLLLLVGLGWIGVNIYDRIKTFFNKRKKDVLSDEIPLF